jgi:MFS family permease
MRKALQVRPQLVLHAAKFYKPQLFVPRPVRFATLAIVKGNVTESRRAGTNALPRAVWALGLVSLFMDISSEMIHGLLPVFLTSVLGAGTEMIGLIEGVGEATASICKLFSGWLSDRLGKRKVLAVVGYGLAALSKPLFAIAATASLVLGARFSDRIGKGIRDAPRDAHRRPGARGPAGSRLWPAAGARYDRRLRGSAVRHRIDGNTA